MKTFLLFFTVVTYFTASKKSPVIPIVPVPLGANVYVAGYENKVAKYWKNGVSVVVSDSVNNTNALANCIIVAGNDIYLGGYESETTTPNIIAKYWKNGKGCKLNHTKCCQCAGNYLHGNIRQRCVCSRVRTKCK